MVDDLYLNGYAKILGAHASCVYFSICRHVDKGQSAFPSEELIAKEFNMDERTVRRKLKLLVKWNLIKIIRERGKDGKWMRNKYYLLDKSEWKKPSDFIPSVYPEDTVSGGSPEDSHVKNQRTHQPQSIQRAESPIKGTHIYEGNTVEGNTHNNNIYITNNQEDDYRKSEQYINSRKSISLIRKTLTEKGVLKPS